MAERNPKYDVLRGLAIVFVLVIHISADFILAAPTTNTYIIVNIVNKLFTTAVPTFVALTVFLGLKSGKKRGPLYFLKKALPLVVLYLIWTAIYIAYYMEYGGLIMPETDILVQKFLLQGQSCYHMYYIVMLLQLYIVIALLSHVPVKKLRPNPWLPLIAVALQMGVLGLFIKFIIFKYWFYNTAVFVFFYLTSITYGVCLAANSNRTEAFFKRFWWLYALIMILTALIRAWLFTNTAIFGDNFVQRNLSENIAWELFIFGGVPVMFLLAELLKNFSPLALLGRHSLGIYFAHPLVLFFVEEWFHFNTKPQQIPLGMIVKFAAAIVAALIFSLIMEGLKWLFLTLGRLIARGFTAIKLKLGKKA
ncbi:MAG: acyltransferase [Oscillospiraceae bacterium]|nr:acyltransferase [Oscillospiraceae bacterium]